MKLISFGCKRRLSSASQPTPTTPSTISLPPIIRPGERHEYAYDAVGNRTAMTETTALDESTVTTYTYDTANRLLVSGSPGHFVAYTWDERGNLIDDGTFTYQYDAAGRMVSAVDLNSTNLTRLDYTYTVDSLRVARSLNGDVTNFVWDWASGLPEMLSDGDNLYLVGHETLGQFANDEWTYYLPDALGSIRQTTDDTGTVTGNREWAPFGVEVSTGQAGLGYTGEWFDDSVGMVYLRARWYDGVTGRFTRRDPWRGDIKRPATLLRGYAYVNSNPINFIDPRGYKPGRGFTYSCNCGFIDDNHFDQAADSMAAEIIQNVRDSSSESSFPLELFNGVTGLGFGVYQVVEREVLIKEDLTSEEEQEVALGIFQAIEDASEGGWAQKLSGSKYTEEDLVSNLLSFYLALGGEYTLENIKDWCGYLTEEQSIEVYDWYEKHLEFEKVTEWGNPRLATCSEGECGLLGLFPCSECPLDEHCPGERKFPSEKFNIVPEFEGDKWEFVDPDDPGVRIDWPW